MANTCETTEQRCGICKYWQVLNEENNTYFDILMGSCIEVEEYVNAEQGENCQYFKQQNNIEPQAQMSPETWASEVFA